MMVKPTPENQIPLLVKLGEVCNVINGFFFPKKAATDSDGKIPYIKSSDIKSRKVKQSSAVISKNTVKQKNINLIAKGALLIAITGLGIGQIATLDVDAIIDPTVCAVVNEWADIIDTDYLYYFLLINIPFLLHSTKTSVRISSLLIKELELKVLPIEKQKALVKKIDERMGVINNELLVNQQKLTRLKEDKKLWLNNYFNGIKNAELVLISSIATIQSGKTPTESMAIYYGDEYTFFKPEDVSQGMDMKESKSKLSSRGAAVAKLIKPNTLLLVTSGLQLGNVGISVVEAACNKSFTAIKPSLNVSTIFLYYQFQTDLLQQQLANNVVNSNIIKSKVEKLTCFMVSLEQQQKMAEEITEHFLQFDAEIEKHEKMIESLTKEKNLFLSSVFNDAQ